MADKDLEEAKKRRSLSQSLKSVGKAALSPARFLGKGLYNATQANVGKGGSALYKQPSFQGTPAQRREGGAGGSVNNAGLGSAMGGDPNRVTPDTSGFNSPDRSPMDPRMKPRAGLSAPVPSFNNSNITDVVRPDSVSPRNRMAMDELLDRQATIRANQFGETGSFQSGGMESSGLSQQVPGATEYVPEGAGGSMIDIGTARRNRELTARNNFEEMMRKARNASLSLPRRQRGDYLADAKEEAAETYRKTLGLQTKADIRRDELASDERLAQQEFGLEQMGLQQEREKDLYTAERQGEMDRRKMLSEETEFERDTAEFERKRQEGEVDRFNKFLETYGNMLQDMPPETRARLLAGFGLDQSWLDRLPEGNIFKP
jgi:hypothetical protein